MGQRSLRHRLLGTVGGVAVCTAACVAAYTTIAPSVDAATLTEAVTTAITSNPEIGEAQQNRHAIDSELDQARGLYYPQIDFRAEVGPEYIDDDDVDEPDEWNTRWITELTAQQLIWDGNGRESEVERQASRVDSAAFRVYERSEFIGLDVVRAYLDVLRQLELVQIARENIAFHQDILGAVQQRASAGRSSEADVRQVDSRLRAAESALVDIQKTLEEARIAYQKLVGDVPTDLSLPASIAASLPSDVDAAVDFALQNNPTMQIGLADIDVSYAEFRASEAPFYPRFNIEAGVNTGEHIDADSDERSEARALLVMRWNLFRGGIDTANRQEQIERIGESRQRYLRFGRTVAEEVRQSWNDLQTARSRASIIQQEVQSNEEVLAAYRQQFNIGVRTLLDVLDAENDLFNSRVSLTTERYRELFAGYRLLASQGVLLQTLGVALPAEATADARAGADVPPTPEADSFPPRPE
jgi:adhesin transport system outer membrane protein